MSREIAVKITGDSRDLERALGKSSKAGSGFGSKLAKGGKLAGLGIAAGVGVAVVAMKSFTDKAKESEVSEAKLRAQLKASGLSWKKHGVQITETTGRLSKFAAVDDEEVQDSFTNLLRVTGDVNKSLKLNALVADVSRGANLDMATASKLVGKVQAGNTGILGRYGIQLKKGTTAQEALGILQKKFAGQAEAYGKTTAGAQDRFAVALENVQEKLGQKLLPVLTRLFNWGIQFMEWSEENWPRFRQFISDSVDKVRPIFERLVEYWNGTLLPAIQNIIRFARALWARFGNDIKRNLMVAIGIIRNLLNVIKGIFELALALIRGDWSAAWAALKSIARNAMSAVVSALKNWATNVGRVAKTIGTKLKDGIVNALHGLAGLVGSAVRGAINAAIDAFNALGDFTIPVPLAPDIHVNFPNIPHVATGGHVARSGLAMIHRGEDIISAARSNGGGGGGRVQVIVVGGDRSAIEWLERTLNAGARTGRLGRFGVTAP